MCDKIKPIEQIIDDIERQLDVLRRSLPTNDLGKLLPMNTVQSNTNNAFNQMLNQIPCSNNAPCYNMNDCVDHRYGFAILCHQLDAILLLRQAATTLRLKDRLIDNLPNECEELTEAERGLLVSIIVFPKYSNITPEEQERYDCIKRRELLEMLKKRGLLKSDCD